MVDLNKLAVDTFNDAMAQCLTMFDDSTWQQRQVLLDDLERKQSEADEAMMLGLVEQSDYFQKQADLLRSVFRQTTIAAKKLKAEAK